MERERFVSLVRDRFHVAPMVALVGSRQSGKTTLALDILRDSERRGVPVVHFDLEDPRDLALLDQPQIALEATRGLVVIDEIQRRPDLFPLLRVLVDRGPKSRRFLVLGSASGDLLRQTSESLAGRLSFVELPPFSHFEVKDAQKLWLVGGYPRAYLSKTTKHAFAWLDAYVTTFLERDIPNLGLRVPAPALRRFWMMLAHYHGQILNQSEMGRALGVTDKTVRHHLDLLSATFMVRQLQPWHENIGKRQVKAPKIYFRDTGLLHALLGTRTRTAIERHPKLGASWEGFALESVVRELGLSTAECFYWATHGHAELDLLVHRGGRRFGFEFKRADAPGVTKSMRLALADLKLQHLFVVTPGDREFPLADRISALGFDALSDARAAWRKRF